MKTKAQKAQAVEAGGAALKASETVVFTDFTGLSVNELNALRKTLKAIGATLRVMKKRLVRVMFAGAGVSFDEKQYGGQMGVVFSPKDAVETAGILTKFGKQFEKKGFMKILGGFTAAEKALVDRTTMVRYGSIPPKEVLLTQLVYILSSPIRSLAFVLDQAAKKSK
jgi:large subunit ribosomal protein L10